MSGATTTTRHGDLIGAGLILLLTAPAPTVEWLPPEAPLNAGAIPRLWPAVAASGLHGVHAGGRLRAGLAIQLHQRFGLCVRRAFRRARRSSATCSPAIRWRWCWAARSATAARPGAAGRWHHADRHRRAHARAGRQCAVPQIRPHEIHPGQGCEGRGRGDRMGAGVHEPDDRKSGMLTAAHFAEYAERLMHSRPRRASPDSRTRP